MPNHVHVIGVPNTEGALSRTFNTVHMQYAQYHNRTKDASGHLWQGRYFSCVLDEAHVYAAVRYVEMNPVCAGLATSAQDYPWSSAKSHVSGGADPVVSGIGENIWRSRRRRRSRRPSSKRRPPAVPAAARHSSRRWKRFLAGALSPFLRADPVSRKAQRRPRSFSPGE